MSVEQRFATDYREEAVDEPGLVLTDAGIVEVVRGDGTTREPIPSIIPFAVSAPFAGATDSGGSEQLAVVAPYDATLTTVAYVPGADITFTSGKSRTWQLKNATKDNVIVAEATYADTQFDGGVMTKNVVYPLNVLNDTDQNILDAQDVLVAVSVDESGSPADPGGLFVIEVLDPFKDR